MINNWSEKRIGFILISIVILTTLLYLVVNIYWPNIKLPCYNTLSFLVSDINNSMVNLYINQSVIYIFNFAQYILLMRALFYQWNVELEYNMSNEILLILILWFTTDVMVNLSLIFPIFNNFNL
jgi:hypothetical protein